MLEKKNEKNYMGFLMHKIWQILKHLSRVLIWAQTSYFWGVSHHQGILYIINVVTEIWFKKNGNYILT